MSKRSAKRPNCPACGMMVRFNDSVAKTEYGTSDNQTLVTKIWHKDCLKSAKSDR